MQRAYILAGIHLVAVCQQRNTGCGSNRTQDKLRKTVYDFLSL
jgi:hypothetical protein